MKDPDGLQAGRGPESPTSILRRLGPLLTAGIQMAVTIVVMFFIGRWLDGKFGTAPWLMIIGGLVGSAGGLISFIRMALAVSRGDSDNDSTSSASK